MIVLDAYVAVEVFVRTPLGMRHEARILTESRHAPHLIDVELLQALKILQNARKLPGVQGHFGIGQIEFRQLGDLADFLVR